MSEGINIPRLGTSKNNPLLMMGTPAPQGPVLPYSIEISPAIAAFGDGTEITFDPKLAGQPTEVTVTFRNEQRCTLNPNEEGAT